MEQTQRGRPRHEMHEAESGGEVAATLTSGTFDSALGDGRRHDLGQLP